MSKPLVAAVTLAICGICPAQDNFGSQSTDNLLQNPGFELGTVGWYSLGGQLYPVSDPVKQGGLAAKCSLRTQTWMGPAQDILPLVQVDRDYLLSAWVRVSGANSARVNLTLKKVEGSTTWTHLASADVGNLGWTKLLGGFKLAAGSNPSELTIYLEGPPSGVDLLVDYCELSEAGDWRAAADARIEKFRKRGLELKVVDNNGAKVVGANIELNQQRHHFGFGTAISELLVSDPTYRQFFLDTFEWAVFENQTKWSWNEAQQGQLDYAAADLMFAICEQNQIPVRGHCGFWAVEQFVQSWVKQLDNAALVQAMMNRISSVGGRYAGKFEHWDVNNEMLHGSWYGDRLGKAAGAEMFKEFRKVDPAARLFVNDYSVVSGGRTADYLRQIADLVGAGAAVGGIGAQCHFWSEPIPTLIYARLDQLAATGLPVWVTEFDVADPDQYQRADQLERFYRIAFSHPGVDGILMWGFWAGAHWRGADAALVNLDWTINAAGQRYLDLMDEWSTAAAGPTGANGRFDLRAFHGEFDVLVTPPGGGAAQQFAVQLKPGNGPKRVVLHLQ